MAKQDRLRDPDEFTSLEDFLKEERAFEEVTARAIKRGIALSLAPFAESDVSREAAKARRKARRIA